VPQRPRESSHLAPESRHTGARDGVRDGGGGGRAVRVHARQAGGAARQVRPCRRRVWRARVSRTHRVIVHGITTSCIRLSPHASCIYSASPEPPNPAVTARLCLAPHWAAGARGRSLLGIWTGRHPFTCPARQKPQSWALCRRECLTSEVARGSTARHTAMKRLRIPSVTLGLGTARQRMVLE
jgi:hypothetical protein